MDAELDYEGLEIDDALAEEVLGPGCRLLPPSQLSDAAPPVAGSQLQGDFLSTQIVAAPPSQPEEPWHPHRQPRDLPSYGVPSYGGRAPTPAARRRTDRSRSRDDPPGAMLPLRSSRGAMGSGATSNAHAAPAWQPQLDGAAGHQPHTQQQQQDEDWDDAEEEALASMCMREGPPGPAGAALALGNVQADGQARQQAAPHAVDLSERVGWLAALRALDLPFDRFHLGGRGAWAQGGGASPSALARHNLAAVARDPWPPKRWHLVVLVKRVEFVAGEIDIVACDPTGEVGASVDRELARARPNAVSEGAALLLADVVAVPPLPMPNTSQHRPPRLLIMEKSLVKSFVPSDIGAEEAERLLRDARGGVGSVR